MPRHVVLTGPRTVELQERLHPPLVPGAVRVAATRSVVSAGTELRCYTGEFAPGTHWADYVRYPMSPGYSTVGVVTETTDPALRPLGTRVFLRRPHASEFLVPIASTVPVPEDVPDEVGAWAALAMVGAMGFRAADARLGDAVAILGAGPIGQMALRWCVAAGARVAVFDPAEPRLRHARDGGAEATFAAGADDAPRLAREAFGELPRIVFDTTGVEAVFAQALAIPRDHGALVLLGDAGDPSEQRLTSDVVTRGVRVVGAHMNHEDALGVRGEVWTERTIVDAFFRLWRAGRFPVEGLVTDRYPPEDAPEVYRRLAAREPATMGFLFEWPPEPRA